MKYIVYNCTSYPAGGLADRLKGLISCYGLSVKTNRQFILNWTYPFKLNDILKPNKVNWMPRPIQGTYREIFAMDSDMFLSNKNILDKGEFQEDIISIKTNINFLDLYNLKFNECFNDLFIVDEKYKKYNDYIGLACRFGGIESDWKDIDFNREISFDYVYEKLIKISIENNINNFYICSDSSKFLNFLKEKKLNYVTSLGTPRHIDYPGCTLEGYNKTFDDFLSLRQCKVICYIKGGFAATSALTSGKKAICL